MKARVRRLLRADGQPVHAGLVNVLAEGDAVTVRRRYLAWFASHGRVEHSSAGQLQAWLDGEAHAELDRVRGLGLPLRQLLGVHELVLRWLERTVRICLRHDLGAEPEQVDIVGLAQSLDAELLVRLQRALLAHPRPGTVHHISRLWPLDRSLTPLRQAYLRMVDMPSQRSVVGFCQRMEEGRREGLADWDRLDDEGRIPLLCGVELKTGPTLRDPARCFSALELIERHTGSVWTTEGALEAEAESSETTPSPEQTIEDMLVVLGRAALGPVTWLPEAEGRSPLQRWTQGLNALVERVERRGGFDEAAARWLQMPPIGGHPTSRWRAPGGGHDSGGRPANQFRFDPVGSAVDTGLFRACLESTKKPRIQLVWFINEWTEARQLLGWLAREAGFEHKGRSGVIWLHRLLFDEKRSEGAWRKAVSIEGRVPWCLVEVEEAVTAARPHNVPDRLWRRRCAGRVRALPTPWATRKSWSEGHRDLAWLSRTLAS